MLFKGKGGVYCKCNLQRKRSVFSTQFRGGTGMYCKHNLKGRGNLL